MRSESGALFSLGPGQAQDEAGSTGDSAVVAEPTQRVVFLVVLVLLLFFVAFWVFLDYREPGPVCETCRRTG